MNAKRKYSDFYEVINSLISAYANEKSLDFPVRTFLYEKSLEFKEPYDDWRMNGIPREECIMRLQLSVFPDVAAIPQDGLVQSDVDLATHRWYQSLNRFSGQLLFYISNNEQFVYLLPLLKELNRSVVLLLESGVNDDLIDEDHITIVEIDFISELRLYNNQLLENSFPEVYKYYNTFSFLIEALDPEGVVLMESPHFQPQVMSLLAEGKGVPCLAIQQSELLPSGLPCPRFPYSYLLTWGESFNKIWSIQNPCTKFISTGYITSVNSGSANRHFLFFLGSSLPFNYEADLESFVRTIDETAKRYPEKQVLIYNSSANGFDHSVLEGWEHHGNIHNVSGKLLSEVLPHSQVMVSFCCSGLAEMMLYGCIPLIFAPVSDIDALNIKTFYAGEIASCEEDFFLKLDSIQNSVSFFRENIACEQNKWFCAIGKEAVRKTSDCINKIACCQYLKQSQELRLHIGCGKMLIEGWVNVDIEVFPGIYYLDAGRPYPIHDNSFSYIFSEHLFEHLTLQQGITMLRECYRILKPGGKKRIAMPDFNFLIDLYLHPEKEINRQYINWSTANFIPEIEDFYHYNEYPPVYVFNNFCHAWGHQFIHTYQGVKELAEKIGFKNIKRCIVGESDTPVFQSIERHGGSIPDWANELETMILEMEK